MTPIRGRIVGQDLILEQNLIAADTNDYLTAEFTFGDEWTNRSIWAHFRLGDNTPWDINLHDGKILESDHLNLSAGVYEVYFHGTGADGSRVTTVPCDLRVRRTGILEGQPLPEIPITPAEQIDQKAQSALDKATDVENRANAGEFDGDKGNPGGYYKPSKAGSNIHWTPSETDMPEVPDIPLPGGGGGTSDHRELTNRDAENQHPMSAITGLTAKLAEKAEKTEIPDVPDWAMKPNKPTYTAEEVNALPDTTVIPTKTSELTNDSGFITDVDVPKKLPNPNAITFTGASTGTYDGSVPLTVNIPAGGGGGIVDSTFTELINHTVTEAENESSKIMFTVSEYPELCNFRQILFSFDRVVDNLPALLAWVELGSTRLEIDNGHKTNAGDANSQYAFLFADATTGCWLYDYNQNIAKKIVSLAPSINFACGAVSPKLLKAYTPWQDITFTLLGGQKFATGQIIRIWGRL